MKKPSRVHLAFVCILSFFLTACVPPFVHAQTAAPSKSVSSPPSAGKVIDYGASADLKIAAGRAPTWIMPPLEQFPQLALLEPVVVPPQSGSSDYSCYQLLYIVGNATTDGLTDLTSTAIGTAAIDQAKAAAQKLGLTIASSEKISKFNADFKPRIKEQLATVRSREGTSKVNMVLLEVGKSVRVGFGYDMLSRLSNVTYMPSGIQMRFAYDALGMPTVTSIVNAKEPLPPPRSSGGGQ